MRLHTNITNKTTRKLTFVNPLQVWCLVVEQHAGRGMKQVWTHCSSYGGKGLFVKMEMTGVNSWDWLLGWPALFQLCTIRSVCKPHNNSWVHKLTYWAALFKKANVKVLMTCLHYKSFTLWCNVLFIQIDVTGCRALLYGGVTWGE